MKFMVGAKLHGLTKVTLVHSLKVWDDPQHAIAYTGNRLALDKPFADKWREKARAMKVPGVQFVPVLMDCHVELLQNGVVIRHVNETSEVKA